MKIWFFVEGESEIYLVKHLMRAVFINPREINDLMEFVIQDHGTENVYSCFDCNSVENIPFRLKEYAGNIIASKALVVVVCDTEQLPCFSRRKEIIFSKMAKEELRGGIRFVFSKPNIEAIFWEFPEVIERTIKKLANYSQRRVTKVTAPTVTRDFSNELKKLCKQYNIRYKKGEFAEHFFGILGSDFERSATLARLKTVLSAT
jgi:hypothetical protein